VKGRIALHKHCILARFGGDGALSGGCFESAQNRVFGQMTNIPDGLSKKSGAVPRHQKRSTKSHSIRSLYFV